MQWSERPDPKLEVPRHFLETLADQMADPETWAYMLREHTGTKWKRRALPDQIRG